MVGSAFLAVSLWRIYSYHQYKQSLREFDLRLLVTTKSRGFEYPGRFYSTKATISCNYVKKSLEPWFVTGFSDAESCFMITLRENPGCNLG